MTSEPEDPRGPLRLLFDVSHPAHVQFLRPVIQTLTSRGHVCRVAARDKDVELRLLRAYQIPYDTLAPVGRGTLGRLVELVRREIALVALARRFRPHLIVGTSINAARVAWLLGTRSVVINEDDAKAVPLFRWLAYPLATLIVTPDCLAHERWGPHHKTYRANQELIYLHPSRFAPDPGVRRWLGLDDGSPYAIVRLSALEAHHDVGVRGIGESLLRDVEALVAGKLTLFISGEKALAPAFERLRIPIPPERMLDALAHAEFYLGDSQTMAAEAAVLGTPAFRLNDFVGRISYLAELEQRELAYGFTPGQEEQLLTVLKRVLDQPNHREAFAARRARLLSETIDPLPWLVGLLDDCGRRVSRTS